MGTDIHSRAEVLGDDGTWRAVGRVFPYPYYREGEPTLWNWYDETAPSGERWQSRPVDEEEIEGLLAASDPERCYVHNERFTTEPIVARNYRLFAVLADVRNGRGFAGVDTGDAVEPVAYPRGVPSDASPEWLSVVEHWGVDLHSTSWLTLEELLAYNWDRPLTIRGQVGAGHYETLTEPGQTPKSWAGGVSGPNVKIYNEVEYRRKRAAGEITDTMVGTDEPFGSDIYVAMQWHVSLRSMVTEFIDETLPALGKLHTDPARVRIVFGFDN